MDYAEYVRMCRHTLGMKSGEFAKALGTWQDTVSVWESGLREPAAKSLLAMEDLAGIPLDPRIRRGMAYWPNISEKVAETAERTKMSTYTMSIALGLGYDTLGRWIRNQQAGKNTQMLKARQCIILADWFEGRISPDMPKCDADDVLDAEDSPEVLELARAKEIWRSLGLVAPRRFHLRRVSPGLFAANGDDIDYTIDMRRPVVMFTARMRKSGNLLCRRELTREALK